MLDKTTPQMRIAASVEDEFHLDAREQRLIRNFRAAKESAKEMLVDLSDQYKRTLPAARVKLQLLRPAK
jgi:hypothetical protein